MIHALRMSSPAHLQGRKTFSDPDVQAAVREDMEGMGRTAISSIDLAMAMLPGAGAMEAGGSGVENLCVSCAELGRSASYPVYGRGHRGRSQARCNLQGSWCSW